MICTHCGAEVDDREVFCPECGAKLERRAAGDTLAMRMSRRELEEQVSYRRLRKRVRRVAKLVGIMFAFVIFFAGGTFAVQEVMSRYDVGKYLGKLGMEDIAESLGIEVPETEAPKEEAETGEASDTDETEHVVYETDGAEDAEDTEDGEAAQE